MKTLIAVGTFNAEGGKSSSIGTLLASELKAIGERYIVNGGTLQRLEDTFNKIPEFDVVVWMPNVDNSLDKYLPRIKEINQRCLLVSSKRVVEKTYTEWDVVGRLLKTKSNLGIMITQLDGVYHFKLLDPLGNIWSDTSSVAELAGAIYTRITFLSKMTRLPSIRKGDALPFGLNQQYLKTVHYYGKEFSKYVNAMNPNRFLGNTATRCMQGFPGMRGSTGYYISRRNVDKTGITSADFVEVTNNENVVEYFGDNKPSVDTPIQVRLFNFYTNVNFIIHGHVYITKAPMTPRALPCGAVEEFSEIRGMMPFASARNFAVNLRGHGCLLLAQDLDFLREVTLMSRPFPEVQHELDRTAVGSP